MPTRPQASGLSGFCTGAATARGGKMPTAPWMSRCITSSCATWGRNKWCPTAGGPNTWGWCYPCKRVPSNNRCLRNGSRITRKRCKTCTKWYSATVTRCRSLANGRTLYSVRYADGDRETNVQGSTIRSGSSGGSSCTFRRGQTIQGNYRGGGRWYTGTISAVNSSGCTYSVRYNDGDRESSVAQGRIRSVSSGSRCSFRTGSRISGNYQGRGRWYAGVITGCSRSSGYSIRYNDGDRESNVPDNRVRGQ